MAGDRDRLWDPERLRDRDLCRICGGGEWERLRWREQLLLLELWRRSGDSGAWLWRREDDCPSIAAGRSKATRGKKGTGGCGGSVARV